LPVPGLVRAGLGACERVFWMSESAWPEVVAAAPYSVEVLPADSAQAQRCVTALGMSTP
jgi:hypothetical protein